MAPEREHGADLSQYWSEREEDVDLRQYWSVISRNKWAILGLSGAASLLAALVVFAMTPIYQASVTILIESQQAENPY